MRGFAELSRPEWMGQDGAWGQACKACGWGFFFLFLFFSFLSVVLGADRALIGRAARRWFSRARAESGLELYAPKSVRKEQSIWGCV